MKYVYEFDCNRYDYDDCVNKCGVYGIFVDGVVRYIGKTERSVVSRYAEHYDVFVNKREP